MATPNLPPPPIRDLDQNSRVWQEWYRSLTALVTGAGGLIAWTSISKAGSNLTEIATRLHNDLQSMQGGSATERYHLTLSEWDELHRVGVTAVTADTAMGDTVRTILVNASAKTITLPAASATRVGHDWTVILGVRGYTTIIRAGTDTLTLPETSTTIRLDTQGASVTLRCLTASSWGIA